MAYKGYNIPYVSVLDSYTHWKEMLVAVGWTAHDAGVKATQTFTVTGQPANTNTIVCGGKTYTWKTSLTPAEGEIKIGVSAAASLDNFKNAVNGDAGTLGADHQCTVNSNVSATTNTDTTQVVEFLWEGTYGNASATTDTTANGAWGAATLTGGVGAVYSSTGEAGTRPPGYLKIDYATAFTIAFWIYGYWNAVAHTGTLESYQAVTMGSLLTDYGMYGNKDWVEFFHSSSSSNTSSRCWIGRPTHYVNSAITTTTAAIEDGSGVSIAVSDSSVFGVGDNITIWGVNGEGRDKLLITAIADSTHITVQTVLRHYASGSWVGTPAQCFCMAHGSDTYEHHMNDVGFHTAVGLTEPVVADYANGSIILAANAIDPDSFSNRFILSPIKIECSSSGTIGFLADGNIYGTSGILLQDICGVNTDKSIPTGGDVSSAAAGTLVDSTQSWGVNAHANRYAVITAGTGASQARKIASNDGTTLTLSTNWATTPDVTSDYKICDTVYRCISTAGVAATYTLVKETDHSI